MATLPLTVTEVTRAPGGLWLVTVALADGTLAHYLVPDSLATIEAVRISAMAMGMLLDPDVSPHYGHHKGHSRLTPRFEV